MKRNLLIIVFLLVLAILIRTESLLTVDNNDGSPPMERVVGAISINENPRLDLNFDGNSSVLYEYSLALFLYFWHDPLLAPRIFTMIFGVLTIVPYYFLIRMLFSERIAFYSGILFALYPFHAIFSTISMPGVVFHFFLFCSLYYLFKFEVRERKLIWVIVSALLFNIAAMLRFESWSLIPFLSLIIYKKREKRYSIIFFALSLILPLIWVFLCYKYTKNPFYSFVMAGRTAFGRVLYFGPEPKQILGWFRILTTTIGYTIVLSGIVGMGYAFFKKKFLHLALMFLFLYFLYTINVFSQRMAYFPRYSIILGLLILPYSVVCFEKILSFVKLKQSILILFFVFLSICDFRRIFIYNAPVYIYPKELKKVAIWLKENVPSTKRLIIGSDELDMSEQFIVVRSGIPPRNFHIVVTPFYSLGSITKDTIEGYITAIKPNYLVLNSTGFLQEVLNFDMSRGEIIENGHVFKLVYSIDGVRGKYNIYKIQYDNNGYENKVY